MLAHVDDTAILQLLKKKQSQNGTLFRCLVHLSASAVNINSRAVRFIEASHPQTTLGHDLMVILRYGMLFLTLRPKW